MMRLYLKCRWASGEGSREDQGGRQGGSEGGQQALNADLAKPYLKPLQAWGSC